jgi:hypothetical protein
MAVGSRRSFLKFGLKVTVVGAAAATLNACGQKSASGGAAAGGCVDLDALTASEQSLRKSFNYVDKSQTPGETCSVCSFFTPGEGECGTCEIFTGGPASAGGRCDSWAAKPA